MKTIYFDTETTGLPNFDLRARDPSQPHLVEFAGMVVDDAGGVVDEFVRIVKPDGWIISPEMTAIHGISHEQAMDTGWPEAQVAEKFYSWMTEAGLLVGHNVSFDKFLMRIAARRYDIIDDARGEWWSKFPQFCTMKASTNLCQLPNPKGRGYKWPKLSEVYNFAFGMQLNGAHDALVDVRACRRVHQWLNDNPRAFVAGN